jgi:hypothetical protein
LVTFETQKKVAPDLYEQMKLRVTLQQLSQIYLNMTVHVYGRKIFFCSTLSELENFLLCERILINVTTCQANFKSFKRFGAFKGLVEQKKRCIVFNSSETTRFTRVLKWPTRPKKRPNLHKNSSNKLLLTINMLLFITQTVTVLF